MKKIFLSLSTALVVTLSLVGCGKTEPTPADKPSTTEYVTTESEKPSTGSNKPSGNSEIVTETEAPSTTESGHASTVDPSEPVHVDKFLKDYYLDGFTRYDPSAEFIGVLHVNKLYDGSHRIYVPFIMKNGCISEYDARPLIDGYDAEAYTMYCSYATMINVYTSARELLGNQLLAVFDEDYYAATYPEASAFCNENNYSLYEYFKLYGMLEGHNPNANFDLNTYKTNRPELADTFGRVNHMYYFYYAANYDVEKNFAK